MGKVSESRHMRGAGESKSEGRACLFPQISATIAKRYVSCPFENSSGTLRALFSLNYDFDISSLSH